MLLCCFKESKRKGSFGEDEAYSQPLKEQQQQQQQKRHSLISANSLSSFGTSAPLITNGLRPPPLRDRRGSNGKERAPLQKEEKRMIKQRSHESFRLQETNSLPYIDQSPPVDVGENGGSGMIRSTPSGSGRNSAAGMSSLLNSAEPSPSKIGKTMLETF